VYTFSPLKQTNNLLVYLKFLVQACAWCRHVLVGAVVARLIRL